MFGILVWKDYEEPLQPSCLGKKLVDQRFVLVFLSLFLGFFYVLVGFRWFAQFVIEFPCFFSVALTMVGPLSATQHRTAATAAANASAFSSDNKFEFPKRSHKKTHGSFTN